ncbi:HIT family protein [Emticicia sp. W12TSBA100-4]|uniref:HIT family protein n=1 Tax=Emticicia sp. W12TSBA100-4 TaxID=3160965 RepID=UPI003306371B
MASIFSRIIAGEISCHKIAENEQYFAFLDVFPCAVGHVLVVPKQEIDYLFDLSDELYAGLMAFAKQIEPAIRKAVPCKRVGVAVIGLEVPHAHVHLIPMNSMSDMNFHNKLKLSPEELAETAAKIRSFLN